MVPSVAGTGIVKVGGMDSKHGYHSVSHHYSTKMMRTSLAVGVVWGVATLCLAIITGLVFMQVIC